MESIEFYRNLYSQKESLENEYKALLDENAKLRKNPSPSGADDLFIYQNNKKCESIKEDLSSINKQLADIPQEIYEELFPRQEVVQEEEEVIEKKPKNAFNQLIGGYFNVPRLILTLILSVISIFLFVQLDKSRAIGVLCTKTIFNFYCLALLGLLAMVCIVTITFKDISTKKMGSNSDFFALYMVIITIGFFGVLLSRITKTKIVFLFILLIYCIIYYLFRLKLFGKDIVAKIETKSRFLYYYYNLFKKYTLLLVVLVATITLLINYFVLDFEVVRAWLKKGGYLRIFMIIDLVLVGLAVIYYLIYTFLNIKVKNARIIDLIALFVEIFCLEFYVMAYLKPRFIGVIPIIAVTVSFVICVIITIVRIVYCKEKKNV